MIEELTYKVLWVDDQEEIVESTKLDADEYGIELDHYTNWQEAEVALRNNFEDYSAIILDAFCKINKKEDKKEEFINAVLPSLARLYGEKNKLIPWYILSAGTMNYFSHTVQGAEYQHQTSEWGQMLYIKDVPDDDPKNSRFLFENIKVLSSVEAGRLTRFDRLLKIKKPAAPSTATPATIPAMRIIFFLFAPLPVEWRAGLSSL